MKTVWGDVQENKKPLQKEEDRIDQVRLFSSIKHRLLDLAQSSIRISAAEVS